MLIHLVVALRITKKIETVIKIAAISYYEHSPDRNNSICEQTYHFWLISVTKHRQVTVFLGRKNTARMHYLSKFNCAFLDSCFPKWYTIDDIAVYYVFHTYVCTYVVFMLGKWLSIELLLPSDIYLSCLDVLSHK